MRPLNELYDNRDKLDAIRLASLCMALVRENSAPRPHARSTERRSF